MAIKNTTKFCGVDKANTHQFLINGKWICAACGCRWDYLNRKYVPATPEELTILDEEAYKEN